MAEQGIILKALSGFYYVGTEDGVVLECRARGKLRLEGISPLVGDRVTFLATGGGKGALEQVLPRKNSFIRPAVANLDQLVIIASESIPVTEPYLIDRMLTITALRGCDAVVVINKCDLSDSCRLYDMYCRAGYTTIRTSAATGEGLEELRAVIDGKINAFTGNSGVGKSSILNALDPELTIRTGEVSAKLGRGRHTTRHVELFRLGGAWIADTPGFAAFDAQDSDLLDKQALQKAFPEFGPYLGDCRFADCAHVKEKGCAVLEALHAGKIQASRHESYCKLYEQARQVKDWELKDN